MRATHWTNQFDRKWLASPLGPGSHVASLNEVQFSRAGEIPSEIHVLVIIFPHLCNGQRVQWRPSEAVQWPQSMGEDNNNEWPCKGRSESCCSWATVCHCQGHCRISEGCFWSTGSPHNGHRLLGLDTCTNQQASWLAVTPRGRTKVISSALYQRVSQAGRLGVGQEHPASWSVSLTRFMVCNDLREILSQAHNGIQLGVLIVSDLISIKWSRDNWDKLELAIELPTPKSLRFGSGNWMDSLFHLREFVFSLLFN